MFDRLPPLQTLRAFEATGRLLSMTRAAEELHVTHGAVSRHIKTLEDYLGVALFRRLTRRIVLTGEGAEFLVVVTRLLAELTREAERLRGPTSAGRLIISTGISFASKWLGPRLHRLMARHPELDVHLDITDTDVDLNNGQVDAAVRYGSGRAAGRLVTLFPQLRLKSERGYDLVYRLGNHDHPKVRAVRDWLADEIRRFLAEAAERPVALPSG